ncbi:MAG: hypothetical protein L6R40_008578 [Gallowayella cf. fulva]|nr:MAG: hypothetical protein L6R40_008578 [Xanthomendoza cf. fulva]
MYGLGKDELNSAELSIVRTNGSEKSREKPRRGPFTLTPLDPRPKLFGPRDSSPPSDLEAQTHIDPRKFEENLKTLQILNKRLLEEPQNRVIPRRPESRRKWPGNHANTVSSRKIAESLHKGYNVSSYPPRQMSQVSDCPLSPKSKPVPKHLRRPDQIASLRDPQLQRISKTRSENIQPRKSRTIQQPEPFSRGKARQDSGKSFSLPPDFTTEEIQTVPAIKVPPPVASVEIRSSKGRIDSFEGHNLISFFSANSTKTRNSRASSAAHSGTTSKRASTVPSIPPLRLPSTNITSQPTVKAPAVKAPPPTPATTISSLEKEKMPEAVEIPKSLKPSPTKIRFEVGTKTESTRPRPPDIDIEAANAKRRTSFLLDHDDKTPRVSPLSPEAEDAPRGHQSARSTRSFATFASSDLSSAWTFGKAQPMPIFPSVAPRAVGLESGTHTTITPLRPKSKYGRKVKATGMKALPVLPKSPLSPEDVV